MGDLLAVGQDRLGLVGEGLDRVPGDEEGGLDLVPPEQLEDPRHAHPRAVLAAVEHRRRHAVVGQPHREGVEVERQADGAHPAYANVLTKAQLPASSHAKGSSSTARRSARSSRPATWWPGMPHETRSSVGKGRVAVSSIARPTRSSWPAGPE